MSKLIDNPTVLTAGSGLPAGSNTNVQYNDSGVFGGDSGFTYTKATSTGYIAGDFKLTVGKKLIFDGV